jgi:hypothetical protein
MARNTKQADVALENESSTLLGSTRFHIPGDSGSALHNQNCENLKSSEVRSSTLSLFVDVCVHFFLLFNVNVRK